MTPEYIHVTEIPGNKASAEQIERLYHRYHFASAFCQGKEVLEVACGAGMGLGYLARAAHKVVGGDIDEKLVELAQGHYAGRSNIELKTLDAQRLPFPDGSFDLLLLYEAIYYLPEPEKFVEEAFRVLRADGMLIVCTVNKEWPDFNPSPFSTKYLSALELDFLFRARFPNVDLYGAFPVETASLKSRLLSFVKRGAIRLHLMPKTMKGKELFKRIFFGDLKSIPPEIKEGLATYNLPVKIIVDSPSRLFKIIYAIAMT
jgi:ubiquinone/menaquinone biosynthesis C-methylase UbiE